MSLWNFIEIQVTKDLKWLIKEGNPINLEDIWEQIFSEYGEISGDKSTNYGLELSKEITYLEIRLTNIQSIVAYLSTVRRCEELITLLQTGYGFRLAYTDLPGDLKRTINQAKADVVKLQKKQAEYKKFTDGNKSEITRQDFTKILRVLSKFQGYQVKSKDISVAEYLAMINDYNNSIPNGRE